MSVTRAAFLDPGLATLGEVLLLPDRDGALELVHRPAAGVEGRFAVRGRHDHRRTLGSLTGTSSSRWTMRHEAISHLAHASRSSHASAASAIAS